MAILGLNLGFSTLLSVIFSYTHVSDKKEKKIVTGLKLEKQLALYPSSMTHGFFCLSPVLPHHPLLPSLGLFISPTIFNAISMLILVCVFQFSLELLHFVYITFPLSISRWTDI